MDICVCILIETVLMMGHKICFYEEIWVIIPKLSLLLLIWSTVYGYMCMHVNVCLLRAVKERRLICIQTGYTSYFMKKDVYYRRVVKETSAPWTVPS